MSENLEISRSEYKELIRKSAEQDLLVDFLMEIASLSYDKTHLYFSFPENFLIHSICELRCANRLEELLEKEEKDD